MRFKVEQLFHKNAIGIWVLDDQDRVLKVAKPMKLDFEVQNESYMLPEPTIEIDDRMAKDALEKLGQELLLKGFLTADSGELQATKKHLEDMQKLVFDFAGKL